MGTARSAVVVLLRVANHTKRAFVWLLWFQWHSWTAPSNLHCFHNYINQRLLDGGVASTISVETYGAVDRAVAPFNVNARDHRPTHSKKSTKKANARA